MSDESWIEWFLKWYIVSLYIHLQKGVDPSGYVMPIINLTLVTGSSGWRMWTACFQFCMNISSSLSLHRLLNTVCNLSCWQLLVLPPGLNFICALPAMVSEIYLNCLHFCYIHVTKMSGWKGLNKPKWFHSVFWSHFNSRMHRVLFFEWQNELWSV